LLYSRLSEALKLFELDVSRQEEEAETELVSNARVQQAGAAITLEKLLKDING